MSEIKYEVNHLEFLGDKETIAGKTEDFFRAYGSEYRHIDESEGVKYIVTEAIEDGKTIVRLDSMILNYGAYLLPECKIEYTRVDSHPQILRNLHPSDYECYNQLQMQLSRALTLFDNELKRKGINLSSSDKNYWDIFKDSPEYKATIRTEGIIGVRGGFLSYDCEKQILELSGESGSYGRPSDKHLMGLAPLLLEEANKVALVKMVRLDNGRAFLKMALKAQILEEMIANFNDKHIAVDNLS